MARISHEEHASIRMRVEAGQEKVAAVATSYGCTPANIYAILAKLRRQDTPHSGQPIDAHSVAELGEPSAAASPTSVAVATPPPLASDHELSLFDVVPNFEPQPPASRPATTAARDASQSTLSGKAPVAALSPFLPETPRSTLSAELRAPTLPPVNAEKIKLQALSTSAARPIRPPSQSADRLSTSNLEAKGATSKSKGGKTGIALMMRTSDGEEAVHPFRSIEELLSAAKPILRTAAKSPDPIWFSIQTVDLDALEDAF